MSMEQKLKEIESRIEGIDVIKNDINWIKEHLKNNGFVRKEEFKPVKNLVYGLVAIIMTTVIVAFLSLVVVPK